MFSIALWKSFAIRLFAVDDRDRRGIVSMLWQTVDLVEFMLDFGSNYPPMELGRRVKCLGF